mgnify:CR=1 FL=1
MDTENKEKKKKEKKNLRMNVSETYEKELF